MEIDRKELKRRAREAMGLTRPHFWVVTLVYFLITSGVSLIINFIPLPVDTKTGFSTSVLFVNILLTLYSIVVDFGYKLWSLWSYRRLGPGLGSLIQGFSVVGRVVLMELSIYLRTACWTMGICTVAIMPITLVVMVMPSLILPCMVLIYAAVWAIMLRYALAPYLLADHPDDGSNAAVRRSVDLMRGWKWELFKLEFSFIGWELINLILNGLVLSYFLWQGGFFAMLTSSPLDQLQIVYSSIVNAPLALLLTNLVTLPLSLWLMPYRSVARAGFYDARLQIQKESAPPLLPLE